MSKENKITRNGTPEFLSVLTFFGVTLLNDGNCFLTGDFLKSIIPTVFATFSMHQEWIGVNSITWLSGEQGLMTSTGKFIQPSANHRSFLGSTDGVGAVVGAGCLPVTTSGVFIFS